MKHFLLFIVFLSISLTHLNVHAQFYTVKSIEVNTTGDVFSPAYFGNKLVVCANQKDRIFKTVYDLSQNEPVDLYIINPKDSSVLTKLSDDLRSPINDGPITFAKKDQYCVFSKNLIPENKKEIDEKNQSLLGLFYSTKTDMKWSEPIALSFNNSAFTHTHPALSEDGKLLLFASNREGGFGGYDIWYSIYTEKWSEPINLGPKINSEVDELFPVLNGDEILFSSTRKGGHGQLDIYSALLFSEAEPLLMPSPINSVADDFGLISMDQINNGFFSSNRDGKDKLYSFHYDFPVFDNCNEQVEDEFCYTLYEENALDLDINSLIYQWTINETMLKGVSIDYCFIDEGVYSVTLDIIDTVLNETYYNQAEYEVLIEYTQQAFISSPDTVKTKSSFIVSAEDTYLPHVAIKEYYWEHGNGKKTTGPTAEIRFQEDGEYTIQLGIIGIENDTIVKHCSFKKIKALSEFTPSLHLTNIIPSQIEDTSIVKFYEYFGEKNPSDTSTRFSIELGILDSANSERNKIIHSFLSRDSTADITVYINEKTLAYSYLIGNWATITEAYTDWAELITLKLRDAKVRSFSNENDSGAVQIGKPFVLSSIQFDSNKSILRDESKLILEDLLTILKNVHSFGLNISGHTDNTGSESANIQLSKKRVLSIKNYLVSKGIDDKRITFEYHGASKPISTNETEEGKQKNRRVEFKFIIFEE